MSTNTTIDPLAPLFVLVAWLMWAMIYLFFGLVLGPLVAKIMRGQHLHWAWAACALPPLALAYPLLGFSDLTLLGAALCATWCGRRWHRMDIQAGRDLAEIAHARSGPLDALRSYAVRLDPAMTGSTVRGTGWDRDGHLVLGSEPDGTPVSIPLGGPSGGTHTLVVGAAGSGKTVTQTLILTRAIERGMGAIVLDPKHDPALRAQLERAAQAAGRRFVEWSPTGPSVYNPYARGEAGEIVDKLLTGERFTEPHYLRQAQRYLGYLVRVLRAAELEVSLGTIVAHFDPARLELLARGLPEDRARATQDYLDSLTTRQRSDLSGVRDRLAILAESDFAPWLDPRTPDTESFDVLDALQERAVVYFSLESDRRPLLAQMLGVAIVLDLQTSISALQKQPLPSVVAIDEFSAIATEQVTRLFARARSAGVSLVLGTQELADLRVPGREAVLEQVLGNITTLAAHRQVVHESAETVSKLAGTVGAWSTSQHSNGHHTRTRKSVPAIEPDTTRGLPPGWAVVVTFGHVRNAQVTRVEANTTCVSPPSRRPQPK